MYFCSKMHSELLCVEKWPQFHRLQMLFFRFITGNVMFGSILYSFFLFSLSISFSVDFFFFIYFRWWNVKWLQRNFEKSFAMKKKNPRRPYSIMIIYTSLAHDYYYYFVYFSNFFLCFLFPSSIMFHSSFFIVASIVCHKVRQ